MRRMTIKISTATGQLGFRAEMLRNVIVMSFLFFVRLLQDRHVEVGVEGEVVGDHLVSPPAASILELF